MHDPAEPKTDDLKDKQRRHQEGSQPLGRADRAEPLGQPLTSQPLHRAPKAPDLVK